MIEAKKSIDNNRFCYVLISDGSLGAKCFYDPTEGEIYDYEYYIELDDLSKRMLFLSVLGYLDDLGHRTVYCSCDKDADIVDRLGFKKNAENKYVLDMNGYFKGCGGH